MKENISKRDWETISAYLDGQLSERKRTLFESRLDHDQQLRAALDGLRDTRHVLRNAPRLRAPRNFMLSPEMAGQPRRLPHFSPVFGWASAVASFLFVLFMIGDLFSAGGAIPMALNNIPLQEEFSAPFGQAVEEDVLAQPEVNIRKMEEPSTLSVEAFAAPEIFEGDAASEAAAVPEITVASEIESAPKAELTPMTKASDTATAEEAEVIPEAESTGAGTQASAAFSADPEAVEAEQEAGKPDVNAQAEVESTPEQHLLAPPVVETEPPAEVDLPAAEVQPAEDGQLQEDQAVAQPSAAMGLTAEVPTETSPALMPAASSTEIPLVSAPVDHQPGSLVIGIEVILGLLALGTGIAWVYLRRRGG